MTTNKEQINKAFKELRRVGYFAKQDFWCCQSCGWGAMTDKEAEKAVFYHRQDLERFKETGELMLAWSGNGAEIVRIFEHFGLKINWNGLGDTRISVRGE